MPYATATDGTRLYFEQFGTGEPLLLISGQGRDHTTWNAIRHVFARRYRVIVYDHRGTGQSDKPAEPPYTTRGLAQDAIAILDHLAISRAHIYGISMGGRIGQWLGIDHSSRLGALILGCTTTGNAHGVRRPAAIDALMNNRSSNEQAARAAMLTTLVSPAWIKANPEIAEYMSQPSPLPQYVQKLHYQASEKHDGWDLLPTISAPTLIIHGSEDQLNPTANAFLLAKRIPNAELFIVEGGRHAYFVEFPEESNRAVNEFLARHPFYNNESGRFNFLQ